MMGPIASLVQAYDRRRQWTLDLPHLGMPEAREGVVDLSVLPEPKIRDIGPQNKDRCAVCVRIPREDGSRTIYPLLAPCSANSQAASALVTQLVRAGIHPLDIIVGTLESDQVTWTFRNAVDHMVWTHEDQLKLEGSLADR